MFSSCNTITNLEFIISFLVETDALQGIADFRQNLAEGDYGEAANILLSQTAQVLFQHFILLIVELVLKNTPQGSLKEMVKILLCLDEGPLHNILTHAFSNSGLSNHNREAWKSLFKVIDSKCISTIYRQSNFFGKFAVLLFFRIQ